MHISCLYYHRFATPICLCHRLILELVKGVIMCSKEQYPTMNFGGIEHEKCRKMMNIWRSKRIMALIHSHSTKWSSSHAQCADVLLVTMYAIIIWTCRQFTPFHAKCYSLMHCAHINHINLQAHFGAATHKIACVTLFIFRCNENEMDLWCCISLNWMDIKFYWYAHHRFRDFHSSHSTV